MSRSERTGYALWGLVIVFSVCAGLMVVGGRGNPMWRFPHVLWAFAAFLIFNGVDHGVLRRRPDRAWFPFLSVAANILLVSAVLAVSGRRESPFWPLDLLPLFTACLRLDRRHVFWAVAVPAGVLCSFSLDRLWRGDAGAAFELSARLAVLAFSGAVTAHIAFRERVARRTLEASLRRLEELSPSVPERTAEISPRDEPSTALVGKVLNRIQNPLTVIACSAELLMKEMSPDSPFRRDMSSIISAVLSAGRATAELIPHAWAGPRSSPSPQGPLKVLVVDDNEDICRIGERFLKAAGYEVSSANSGDAAVGRLTEDWDIVLSDIDMPGAVKGNELVRRVRAETAADVILMTGYPELSTAVQALRDGAYDYLIKPFNSDTLLAAVRRCAEKRQLSLELAREKGLRVHLKNGHD